MKEITRTTMMRANMPNHVTSYECKYLEITKNMIDKMKNSPRYPNINIDFTEEMMPHHKGAIEMCNNVLKYPIDQRLRLVANSIIQEQTQGIEELKKVQIDLCRN